MFNTLAKWYGYLSDPTPKTKQYEETAGSRGMWVYNRKRPLFTHWIAEAMLADPHVKFGLYLIKGPILSGSRFLVSCDNEEQRQYIIRQINRFWTRSAKLALRSMHYGRYGAEVMYRNKGGQLNFDCLKNLNPRDTQPIVYEGGLTGIEVHIERDGPLYLPSPKCFWTTHGREYNRWWGQSRLYGAHIPWYEYNANEGFRDSRRLFFYKNAFNGGVIRFPWGSSPGPNGELIDNRDVANQMMDKFRNGSGMCLPSNDQPGSRAWDWEPAQSVDIGASFTEYGTALRDEVWEALGVPPEIAKAQGTGAYAGRQIPQEAFYSLLQEIVQDLIVDFDEQVIRPMVAINYGENHMDYDIECFGLLRNLEEDRGNHGEDARQPLGVSDGGQQTGDPYLSQRGEQLQMSELDSYRSVRRDMQIEAREIVMSSFAIGPKKDVAPYCREYLERNSVFRVKVSSRD